MKSNTNLIPIAGMTLLLCLLGEHFYLSPSINEKLEIAQSNYDKAVHAAKIKTGKLLAIKESMEKYKSATPYPYTDKDEIFLHVLFDIKNESQKYGVKIDGSNKKQDGDDKPMFDGVDVYGTSLQITGKYSEYTGLKNWVRHLQSFPISIDELRVDNNGFTALVTVYGIKQGK